MKKEYEIEIQERLLRVTQQVGICYSALKSDDAEETMNVALELAMHAREVANYADWVVLEERRKKNAPRKRAAMPENLSQEELEAVSDFASRHGDRWKKALNIAWMNGTSPGVLHRLRNTHGPKWLAAFELNGGK